MNEDYIIVDPPSPEVTDLPNNIVGEILGPNGDTLSVIYERPVVPMGFHPRKRGSRIVRFSA